MTEQKKQKLIGYKELDKLPYSNIYNLYKSHINSTRVGLLSTFGSGRVLVKKALGSRIILKNGKSILDLTGGFGVLNHGHNHPRILKARRWAQDNLKMEVNKSFLSPALAALSHNLSRLLPSQLTHTFFPNSGSEAIDVAIRLSFKYHKSKRNKILYSDRAFHGKSMGPQSISRSGENPVSIPTFLKTEYFKFNDITSLEKLVLKSLAKGHSDIGAIVIEPFSASTMCEVEATFLIKVRKLCSKHNILLIFDEVYTGFFKTGPFFNFMRCENLSPDILCFAKSLGGGKSSIAGVAYTKKISDNCLADIAGANFLSSTYYGFYEECITAIEAIQIAIDENYEGKAEEINDFMLKLAVDVKSRSGGKIELKGRGALWGLFYKKDISSIQKILGILPTSFKEDKNFALKVYLSSAVNWLFEKKKVLTALSFGFNPHLLISINFSFDNRDMAILKKTLFEVCDTKWEKFIPKFLLNRVF
jgi:putrescine aminotransferase